MSSPFSLFGGSFSCDVRRREGQRQAILLTPVTCGSACFVAMAITVRRECARNREHAGAAWRPQLSQRMSRTSLSLCLLLVACTSESDSSSTITGNAVYRDATTDHSGASASPSTPPPQSARVTITIKGTGQIPQVDPQCALDPAGSFEAHYLSTMNMADGSAYTAAIASGTITTPSGCTIPNLTVGVVTDVVVRGELAINTQNCTTFCEANARADAEAECGTSASAASCRAAAESEASAQCQTTCTTKAHAIVAEVSLMAALFGDLDADALRAAALGDLSANLTFDHLEDASGKDL
jgi:hypothetical protein